VYNFKNINFKLLKTNASGKRNCVSNVFTSQCMKSCLDRLKKVLIKMCLYEPHSKFGYVTICLMICTFKMV